MKKAIILIILSVSLTAVAENFNLRNDSSKTMISLSGIYSISDKEKSSFGGQLAIDKFYRFWGFGTNIGVNTNGCFNVDLRIGPKMGDKFYVAPQVIVGLCQVREYHEYLNSENGDIFKYSRPAPRITLGGQIKLGYNFKTLGIFASVGYKRAFSYERKSMLKDPWIPTTYNSSKNILSAELGLSVILEDDIKISGDNSLETYWGGGVSSMGAFASVGLSKFERLKNTLGHSYGGFANFYCQSGNAEIGGAYNLEFYPVGSNSIYNCAFGIELALGQYARKWSGVALDDTDRFGTIWGVYSFGARASLNITPLAIQIGRVNLSLYGNIGTVAQTPVAGQGDFSYEVSSSELFQIYYAGGLKLKLML